MHGTVPIFGTVQAAVQFWTLIFGLWAVCTVVNIGMASWKGRNPFIWGLAGLIFGPLALLVLLFRPSRNKKVKGKTAQ